MRYPPIFAWGQRGQKNPEFDRHFPTIKYSEEHGQRLAICVIIDQRKVREEKGPLCAFWKTMYELYVINTTTGFTFIPAVAKGDFEGNVPSPLRVRAEMTGTEEKTPDEKLERIGEADFVVATLLLSFDQVLSSVQVVTNAPDPVPANEVLTHCLLAVMHKVRTDAGAEPVLAALEVPFEPPKQPGRLVFTFDNPETTADDERKSYA